MDKLVLSQLGHSWVLDLDGTIVKHNGYLIDGVDTFLPGAEEFLKNVPDKDMIIFLTSRSENYRGITEEFLNQHKIRYDHIIFNAPYGERILVNDKKPSGLFMSYSMNLNRDQGLEIEVEEDVSL